MSFKIPGRDKHLPADIINLFHRLGKLERMSLQQGESLKEYEAIRNEHSDIAIEMPAGHGKTLVGGLIGEFNRLTKNWRVVYACATRQLAHQTYELLKSYGIHAVVLVGESDHFNAADYGKYARSAAIAVTTYSHIFNINSSFSDANQIIFDDAHAAEYSIYGFWSLSVSRKRNQGIFDALFATLGDAVAKHVQDKIIHGTYDPLTDGVDIVPQALWLPKEDDIRELLDAKVEGTNLYYSWSRIRSHLHACQIYISHSTIVIRPVLPPNLRHQPFGNAQERIYMTATIGSGGELERIFGVPYIHKISKFDSGANKVSGRRLILFPEDHFEPDELPNVLAGTIRMQPRVLVLCPSQSALDDMEETLKRVVPEYELFFAKDVEDNMTPFTSSSKGILLLAGRYEGIDLKDEDCRLQIFYDLPIAMGLPEQFLQDRLKATEILKNQLVTRVVQGLGRCTRGTQDYAAVLFLGRRVGEYLYKDEFRKMLPAEIDAEMTFGFSQIDYIKDLASWKEALQDFFEQNETWQAIEDYIISETDNKNADRTSNSANAVILEAVQHEIGYLYALWDEEWEKAHQHADKVLQAYGRNDKFKGYRAWWNYLIACIGVLQGDAKKATEYHNKSIQAAPYKLWLDKRVFDERLIENNVFPEPLELQINAILAKLESYGDRDKRFEKDWKRIWNGLRQKEADHYEPAFRDFGTFLGYQTERPTGKGTPDSVWQLASTWLVFELKTNIENAGGAIPLEDIRQTGFHDKWVKRNRNLGDDAEVTVVLICAKQHVEEYAAHATEGIFLLDPSVIEDMASRLEIILRTVLQKLKYSTYEEARLTLGKSLQEQALDFFNLQEIFRQTQLKDVL
ncbi:helicase C-terminal domain-containing protein [Anoxybacillus sp. FSL W8-0104]|uniref:helicase C-terminal domain-containing protein n=1 Tax=unclassified Anoxybacillus TaxID=2639704 RepID=UPI0030F79008